MKRIIQVCTVILTISAINSGCSYSEKNTVLTSSDIANDSYSRPESKDVSDTNKQPDKLISETSEDSLEPSQTNIEDPQESDEPSEVSIEEPQASDEPS